MSFTYMNSVAQGGAAMAIPQDEIGDLTAEIEKSIRVAQRLKLDLVVYILMMAQIEIATLSAQE